MGWAESPTTSNGSASRSRCGTRRDPILKERLFGLTNSEGNHGEDVKEYYFYLDSTPTHSYMKYLYKYPQRRVSRIGTWSAPTGAIAGGVRYELLDTGVFDDDRYFDVFVEYAKEAPRTSWSASLFTIAGRKRPGCGCSRRCGSATPGPGAWIIESRRCARWDLGQSKPHTTSSALLRSHCDGGAGIAVHREREQYQRLWGQPMPPLRQGCVPRLRRLPAGRRREPGQRRDQGRGALHARHTRRRRPDHSPPPGSRRAVGPGPLTDSTGCSKAGSRTQTNSTRGFRPTR